MQLYASCNIDQRSRHASCNQLMIQVTKLIMILYVHHEHLTIIRCTNLRNASTIRHVRCYIDDATLLVASVGPEVSLR